MSRLGALRPALCCNSVLTLMSCLPAAANSGQYCATGASRSSNPCSTKRAARMLMMPLVQEKTVETVSCPQACPGFASPRQTLTTGTPSWKTAKDEPPAGFSGPCWANSSTRGSKRGSKEPTTCCVIFTRQLSCFCWWREFASCKPRLRLTKAPRELAAAGRTSESAGSHRCSSRRHPCELDIARHCPGR